MRKWIYALAVVLCAVVIWAQELIICKSCGREAKEGEAVCSRCDTPLPKPKQEAPAPAAAPAVNASAEVVKLAAAAVENNYRLARESEADFPTVATAYYQNAMAIMRLVPAGHFPKDVNDALLNGRDRTLQTAMVARLKCRICKGDGKYATCTACKGRGWTASMADVAQAKAALLQGRKEFEQRQMLAGEVRLGQAFVPPEMDKLLRAVQRALVMTGMQPPCTSCQGTARQVCVTCKGLRWVKCPNVNCRNGELADVQLRKGELPTTRLGTDLTKRCPRCEGLGEVLCLQCKGDGSVACQVCSGSGTAARCVRCTGAGLQDCTKCKGTGRGPKDAPCVECGGDGIILCTTCRGEGAKAK